MVENGPAPKPKCSVLIVEDDRMTRLALTRLLAGRGHAVCPAGTVAEALAQLDGQACAILDLNLPDGDGTQILRGIRDQGRSIRCAVVTGSSDGQLIRDAQQCGAELILRKPLDLPALLAWLDQMA